MSDKIWLYWEGPMPEYISLCCETVFVHNDNVELLDRDSSNSSNIMKEFYSKICSIIREDRPLEWLDIGSIPMNDVIACYENESALLPTEAIMPLAWNDSKMLMVQRSDEEQRQNFNETAFCYMLSNNTIRGHDETRTLHSMSKDQLLNSKYFISFLFREALRR